MAHSVTPFLLFEGDAEADAEAAVNLYVSLFRDASIRVIEHYGPDDHGTAGNVKRCEFSVAGQKLRCIDSPVKQAFTFTPSMSLFVDCETEGELDVPFNKLSEGGGVLMPPGNYGFSSKFAWCNDRYGVSWQLNLA